MRSTNRMSRYRIRSRGMDRDTDPQASVARSWLFGGVSGTGASAGTERSRERRDHRGCRGLYPRRPTSGTTGPTVRVNSLPRSAPPGGEVVDASASGTAEPGRPRGRTMRSLDPNLPLPGRTPSTTRPVDTTGDTTHTTDRDGHRHASWSERRPAVPPEMVAGGAPRNGRKRRSTHGRSSGIVKQGVEAGAERSSPGEGRCHHATVLGRFAISEYGLSDKGKPARP